MTTVLEQLERQERVASEESQAAYRALVRRVARDDGEPAPAAVQQTMAAAGKTTAELHRDVETSRDRDDMRARLREYEDALRERPELQRRIAEADARLAEALEAHGEAVAPLRNQLQNIIQMGMYVADLPRRLRDPDACPDPTLKRRLASIKTRLSMAEGRVREQEGQAARVAAQLASARGDKVPPRGFAGGWHREGELVVRDPQRVKELERALRDAEKPLSDARRLHGDLLREQEEILRAISDA